MSISSKPSVFEGPYSEETYYIFCVLHFEEDLHNQGKKEALHFVADEEKFFCRILQVLHYSKEGTVKLKLIKQYLLKTRYVVK